MMTDQTFESILAGQLQAYAEGGVRPIDRYAIAEATIATGRTTARRRWSFAPGRTRLLPVAVALLLLALGAGAVLIGTGWLTPPPQEHLVVPPPTATPAAQGTVQPSAAPPSTPPPSAVPLVQTHDLLVITRTPLKPQDPPCMNLDRDDVESGATKRLVTCADRLAMPEDGSIAAVGGDTGVAILDLHDGHQTDAIETGKHTYPIAWSPDGTWLEWASCGPKETGPCDVEIGSPTDAGRTRLPAPADGGYWGGIQWLGDGSRVLIPTGDGFDLAQGDGSGRTPFHPLVDANSLSPEALSPDGSRYLYRSGPYVNGNTPFMDGWVATLDGSQRSNLTNLAEGDYVKAVAWSPDSRKVALTVCKGPSAGTIFPDVPCQLWLVDINSLTRTILSTPDLYAPDEADAFLLHWSPDGSRIAVEVANRRPQTSIDTVIVPIDGSPAVVLKDARYDVWSPDGSSIAVVGMTGPSSRTEGEPPPPRTFDVANADGSSRHVVATPTGDLDSAWFMWAAP